MTEKGGRRSRCTARPPFQVEDQAPPQALEGFRRISAQKLGIISDLLRRPRRCHYPPRKRLEVRMAFRPVVSAAQGVVIGLNQIMPSAQPFEEARVVFPRIQRQSGISGDFSRWNRACAISALMARSLCGLIGSRPGTKCSPVTGFSQKVDFEYCLKASANSCSTFSLVHS